MEIDKQQLEELGVHDLRRMARSLGVKSPTTKKKEELVDLICEKTAIGEDFNHTQNRGRKCKKSLFQTSGFRFKLPNEIKHDFNESSNNGFQKYISFASGYIREDLCSESIVKTGIVSEYKSYFCLLLSDGNFVYIDTELAKENFLEIGCKVELECAETELENVLIAQKILKVDGSDPFATQKELCDFDDVCIEENSVQVANIKIGSRLLTQTNDNFSFCEEYILDFEKNGFKVLTLGVGLSAIDKIKLGKILTGENFLSLKEKKVELAFFAVNNALNRAEFLARSGEKVVLFIPSFQNVYDELDLYFEEKGEQKFTHTKSANALIRRILGINRTISNGGSVTLLLTANIGFDL